MKVSDRGRVVLIHPHRHQQVSLLEWGGSFSVCVCEREREREREWVKERERKRASEREREREREREAKRDCGAGYRAWSWGKEFRQMASGFGRNLPTRAGSSPGAGREVQRETPQKV